MVVYFFYIVLTRAFDHPALCSDSIDTNTPEIAQWSLSAVRVDRRDRVDPAVGQTIRMQLLLQQIDHSALRSYTADPYSAYAPSRFNVLSCIKAVMNAAATLAVQNKVKEYNDRERQLFRQSVKQAQRYNTDAIKQLFASLTALNGGMLVLQPSASTEINTQISNVSFPAQRSGQAKRIRLVRFDPVAHRGSVMVPTLDVGSAGDMLLQSGAMPYPRIGILRESDYKVIAGALDMLPPELSEMIDMLRLRQFYPQHAGIGAPAGGPIVMPQLLTPATITAITDAQHAYGAPFNIDRVIHMIRDDARANRVQYEREATAAIADLRAMHATITAIAPLPAFAAAAAYPAGGTAAYRTWARPLDAAMFLEWTLRHENNYVLFYVQDIHLTPAVLDWRTRDYDLSTAILYNTAPGKPYGERDDPSHVDDNARARAYVAGDLLRFTTRVDNEGIAALPSEEDVQDGDFRTPVVTYTPMYRFQLQSEENQMRFRLNYVKDSGSHRIQVGAETTDDIADRRGFDSGVQRFEVDIEKRNYQGYSDEMRTFLRVLLQTLFSKTPRPNPDQLPVVGTVDLSKGIVGVGFVGIPAVTDVLGNDPRYKSRFAMNVIATSPYEFYRSYPRWTTAGAPVASAALFLWRHAVSRSTTPFSATADTSNLSDVAAVLSITEPFPVYNKADETICSAIQARVEKVIGAQFSEGGHGELTMLHLVQVTGRVITPGNTNFAQAYTVQFDDAAIRKTGNRYQLEYALGCQDTVLLEAVVIGTSLLRVLQLNHPAVNMVRGRRLPTHVIPETHMVPTELPLRKTDQDYKSEALLSTAMRSGIYGMTNVYKSIMHSDGRIAMDEYYRFFRLDNDYAKNKAARVVLGPDTDTFASGNPDPQNGPSPPGVYTNNNNGTPSPFGVAAGQQVYRIKVATGGTLDNVLSERAVFDDYIFANMLTDERGGNTTLRDAGRHMLENKDHGITVPVYRVRNRVLADYDRGDDIDEPDILLVGFVTVNQLPYSVGGQRITRERTITVDRLAGHAPRQMKIQSYRSVVDNTLNQVYDAPSGRRELRFNPERGHSYFMGVWLSHGMCGAFPTCALQVHLAQGGGVRPFDAVLPKHRFLPMFNLTDVPLFSFEADEWDRNLNAYRSDWKPERPIQHTSYETNVNEAEIAKQIADGFQGFHFSRHDAAGRTTFAVAMNSKLAEIRAWYEAPYNAGLYGSEPRAINLVHPGDHRIDAMLVQLVMEGEKQGQSLTYTATGFHGRSDAVSTDTLITPLVVVVRGPGPTALATPCVVENVYVKTSAFRVVESLLVRHLYTRLRDHPRNLPKGHSPRCLAIFLLGEQRRGRPPIRSLRAIVARDLRFVPPVATLTLQLNDYEKIPKRTDKSRNSIAITAALDGLNRSIYDLLYMV